MGKIELNKNFAPGRKPSIMIFTEGTILGPKRMIDYFFPAKYVPIKDCIDKINSWYNQGARIVYLTSRKRNHSVCAIKDLLTNYRFPGACLYHRTGSEKYKNIVESVKPDILIEDNCRGLGGRWQMSISYVDGEIKKAIKSIIVKEFKGIDFLPDNLNDLLKYTDK